MHNLFCYFVIENIDNLCGQSLTIEIQQKCNAIFCLNVEYVSASMSIHTCTGIFFWLKLYNRVSFIFKQ